MTDKKRKESGSYIETRNRKKAREALDLISNSKQRQESLFNLLGDEYTGPSEAQLSMIFRLFDTNNDGKIGAEELKAVLRAMGKRPLTKRIDKILYECDENQNGTIELDEFIRYMQKKAAEKAKQLGLLDSDDEEDEEEDQGGDTDEEAEDKTTRKAAGAKPKKRKAQTTASSAQTTTTTTTNTPVKSVTKQPSFFAPIKRGSSIVHFYTENAGTHQTQNVQLDKYNNPSGLEHDLGLEGAFTQFKILIGGFYPYPNSDSNNALKSKGFTIVDTKTQKEFIEKLKEVDVALIVSGYVDDKSTTQKEFVDAVKEFHESGKGLFLWSDNTPYTLHSNWVTKELFGVEAHGNEIGKKELSLGKGTEKQQFSSHLVTTGINNLYEGVTISSFAKQQSMDKLEILASSSEGNAIILVSDNTKMPKNCGRVIMDTGFTKLFSEYFTAGTERYIKNACVWLLSLDQRFSLGVEVSGAIPKPKEEPVWQYHHGSWYDYDSAASKVVEEAYQEWLTNPNVDVRSVTSGFYAYQINFKENTQTNIQHPNHTTREIRRIMKQVVQSQI